MIPISVIIPLYNKARHITRAVNSVLAQTFPPAEVIVVDDGSTDDGLGIVRRIGDPRIRLISQVNAGASAARNRGVAESRSIFIAFIDADDEWEPDFLSTMAHLQKQFPHAGVWGSAYVSLNTRGTLVRLQLDPRIQGQTGGLLLDLFTDVVQQPFNASSMMVRKDALLAAHGFPDDLVYLEDTNTLFRLALRYPVGYCPVAKAIIHLEADNRSDRWNYVGNLPFFDDYKTFRREGGVPASPVGAILRYMARYHVRTLYGNWLMGDRQAMLEVIRDWGGMPGFRVRCGFWRGLTWLPNLLVPVVFRVTARLLGRAGYLPSAKSLYRSRPWSPTHMMVRFMKPEPAKGGQT